MGLVTEDSLNSYTTVEISIHTPSTNENRRNNSEDDHHLNLSLCMESLLSNHLLSFPFLLDFQLPQLPTRNIINKPMNIQPPLLNPLNDFRILLKRLHPRPHIRLN